MDSWWQLGEGYGYRGNDLRVGEVTCPFCMEEGNFDSVFHAEKKKPNSDKKLNFDTLECGNCKGYVMVLWSVGEYSSGDGLYDFKVLPWPLRLEKFPDYWPEPVGRYWLQAKRNVKDENWDAAAVMARSALQISLRDHGAEGRSLKQEIEDLASKGILPPNMKEWAQHVRELGNDSAHPGPEQGPTSPQDARDIVRFLDFLLEYLYSLPHRIQQYRERAE
jgi:hypothetical protein